MKNVKIILVLALVVVGHVVSGQKTEVLKISENAGIHTDRRPISVGFYASEVGKTFVSWMGSFSHPIVKEYNHQTKIWSEDKKVGESPFADKHNYPALIRGNDDHLYVFYGCHNSTLKMSRSTNPLSIDGEWEDVFIDQAKRASYPAPVITQDGIMYVFYRDTRKTNNYSDDRPYRYVMSVDSGKTWVRSMAIDNFPRNDNFNEIYNGKVSYQRALGDVEERIHLSWTICGGGHGKHSHASYGTNAYYAWMSTANHHFYSVHGDDLGLFIDNDEADKYCLVADLGYTEKGHLAGLQISVHYLDNGFPLVFHNVPGKGYGSSTWTGKDWVFSIINDKANEPRDISKIGDRAFRVYLTGGESVLVYQTKDAGGNWILEEEIHVGQNIIRCHEIDNYHPEAWLLVSEIKNDRKNVKEANRDMFIIKK